MESLASGLAPPGIGSASPGGGAAFFFSVRSIFPVAHVIFPVEHVFSCRALLFLSFFAGFFFYAVLTWSCCCHGCRC